MASYTVQLQGGGSMTVDASSPAAAIANVIAQGGTPASDQSNAHTAGAIPAQQPGFNRDLTIAFVVLVLAGIALAVSNWKPGATLVQIGLVLAIAVVVLHNEPQVTGFISTLRSNSS